MTITKQHTFRHMFESFEGAGGGLQFVIQVEAHLHFADKLFTGLSLYHTSLANSANQAGAATLATTRTTMGVRDDLELERRRYDVTTIYSLNPIEAASAAISHHLWTWSSEAGGKSLIENTWHRTSYQDQVILPLETIITATCYDRDGLDELSSKGEIYFFPQWQIDLGFGPRTQRSHDWFTKGKYINDVFATADESVAYEIRRQINSSN